MTTPLRISELATPALLLDLTAMEANLSRMASFFEGTAAKLRPHFKNHKCPALAKRQLAAGAIGIACGTMREAESLVRSDVRSVLIANEIAGPVKIRQFAELSKHADVIVGVDHVDTIDALSAASRQYGVPLNVVVDVDVCLGRCGVEPGNAALELARKAIDSGLRFRGLMGYEGRILLPSGPEKQTACDAAMQKLVDTRTLLESNGIPVEIVSAGGTGSYNIVGKFPGVTELQGGSYIVMDTDYRSVCADFEPVLSVVATVISRPNDQRMIADAGLKALSTERGMPVLKNVPGAQLRKLNGEHTVIDINDPALPTKVGDAIEIWVHYSDATVNLHNRMYGVRGDVIEEVFEIER